MEATRNELGQWVGLPVTGWRPPPVPGRITLDGRYCRLEPLDPDQHGEDLFAAHAEAPDERGWTYLGYGPFPDAASYRAWMRAQCLGEDPLFFAIFDQSDRRPAGVASYLRIAPTSGSLEVGHIHFAPRLQRRPAATEAMYLMMKTAFELGYRRYEWKCDALNTPSRRAAQRLGLSYEGIFRQATVYKGRNRDTAWYAAIDSEWSQLNQAFTAWLDPENFDARGQQRRRLGEWTAPIVKQRG